MNQQLVWVDRLGFMPVIGLMDGGYIEVAGYDPSPAAFGGWDWPQGPCWWWEELVHWVVI